MFVEILLYLKFFTFIKKIIDFHSLLYIDNCKLREKTFDKPSTLSSLLYFFII